jgi:hypothetical protein
MSTDRRLPAALLGKVQIRTRYKSTCTAAYLSKQHTAVYCMCHLNQPCVAPPRKRQKTSAAQLAPASSLSVAEDTSPTDTGVLYGLGETTVEESDTYYVTGMHTGISNARYPPLRVPVS